MRRGSDAFYLNGDLTDDRWTIEGLATFTIFDWGKTSYKVGESKVRVNQAENSKNQLVDSIVLEVKQAYLEMLAGREKRRCVRDVDRASRGKPENE